MKNNIYDKLNDLQIDFEEVELNDLERAKLRRTAKSISKSKKKFGFGKKLATIAAVVALLLTAGDIGTGGIVWASAVKVATNIQATLTETLGLSKDAEKYIATLNEPIYIEGKEYKVEEVAADGKDLFITMTYPTEANEGMNEGLDLSHVKVDGKKVKVLGSSGISYPLKENLEISVSALKHTLNKELPKEGTVDLELIFNDLPGLKNKANVSLKIDMGKIADATKTIIEDFKILGKNDIVIKSFTMNPVVQQIVLNFPESERDYMYSLVGKDQNGRKVVFDIRDGNKKEAKLYFSLLSSEVTADQLLNEVEEINFTLNRQAFPKESGRIDTPVEEIGESFVIKLNK